jgi:3-hydroxyacyl-[acyl-carrier-protein] dehydratase
MRFDLIDSVREESSDRIVAIKQVSRAEEYLQDHFPTFPVLPGVMIVETMVQAARRMLGQRLEEPHCRHVLGEVKVMRFASMVRPGEALEVEVEVHKALDDGAFSCRGKGLVRRDGSGETVANGRFTMRPVR